MAAQMEPQQVILQPGNYVDCSIYAFINLWRKMGLEPPSRLQIDAALVKLLSGKLFRVDPDGDEGLSDVDLMNLCTELSYPAPVCYSIIPCGKDMRDCLPAFVDGGFGCLVTFVYEEGSRRYKHSAIVESHTDEHVELRCSVNGDLCVPWTTLDFDYHERGYEIPVSYFHGQSVRFGFYRSLLALWPQSKSQQRQVVISAA